MKFVLRLVVCWLMAVPMLAQTPVPFAAFDVATIKPVDPEAPVHMIGIGPTPDGVDGQNVTLVMLMRIAYGYLTFPLDEQVTGVPERAKTRKYNIKARMSDEDVAEFKKLTTDEKDARLDAMLRALLAERFKLKAHQTTREMPDYELVVAKSGFKLKPPGADDPGQLKDKDGNPFRAGVILFEPDGMAFYRTTMVRLANSLAMDHDLGRIVVDKTGVTGEYSFKLHWTPNRRPGGDGDAVSVFTALQEDAGLRLQPSKGDVPILVIDHVEPPTEN